MSTLHNILGTERITDSRTDLNNNFTALNSDKLEASYLDTDTALTANSDTKIPSQKAVKAYVDAGGNPLASTTTKGIVQEATQAEVDAKSATGSTGARLFVSPSSMSSVVKFGGNGSDGALSISSGTTTIDVGGVGVYIKNYTSISITGTGKLAFSNPHANGTVIVLKCQGNCTITADAPAISVLGMGSAGGLAVTRSTAGSTVGLVGTSSYGMFTKIAEGGTFQAIQPAASTYFSSLSKYKNIIFSKFPTVIAGHGGCSGSAFVSGSGTVVSGAGGAGGGSLVIECAGSWNFTTTNGISVAGDTGKSGSVVGGDGGSTSAGGGGGGGGFCVVLYGTLTANTGTINVSGGVGGAKVGSTYGTTAGAGGGSIINASVAVPDLTYVGGTGANGDSLVSANTEFA